jgi:transcriptional regulator with XRE-family HTH domain
MGSARRSAVCGFSVASTEGTPGVSPKTIARIERGETEKPHGKTLRILAHALAVQPEEIETY